MPEKPTYDELVRQVDTLKARLKEHESQSAKDRKAATYYRRFLKFLPYPVLVRDRDGLITYLNPAFTRTFGWTPAEMKGRLGRDYVPPHLRSELTRKMRSLPRDKSVFKLTTKRLTKSGKMLDVVVRVGFDRDEDHNPAGMILVFRDVTMEKRIDRNRSAMNRISQVLPQYPELRQLCQYITTEIKELLSAEGANILHLDETGKEFYYLSAVHDDPGTQERVRKIRFPVDELLSGQVVKTGKPIMMSSLPEDHQLHRNRNQKIGYTIRNVMVVPLRTKERIIGVITADNKKRGQFDNTDLETLNTIAATVALSIENAGVSEELKKANLELTGLNAAKDKMISHLSHELKTPVAILLSSYKILSRKLTGVPEELWKPTMARVKRNLDRIIGIEDEVYDIVVKKSFKHKPVFNLIFEQCKDAIDAMIAEETGELGIMDKVRDRIDDIFSVQDHEPELVFLNRFVDQRIEALRPQFKHRAVDLTARLRSGTPIRMPLDPLRKVVDGLIRNAVENTPDGGRIHVLVHGRGKGAEFVVQDHGIGLTQEAQKRIFEGFFTAQDTMMYSSKRPFDFNAGGKGADLLRMRIFSERYRFQISMTSRRCRRLPLDTDVCPGAVAECTKTPGPPCDGKTTVSVLFPYAEE